jgi:hypothetical protein
MYQPRVYEFDDSTLQIPIDDHEKMIEFVQFAKSGCGLFRTAPEKMTERTFPLANFFAKAFSYDNLARHDSISSMEDELFINIEFIPIDETEKILGIKPKFSKASLNNINILMDGGMPYTKSGISKILLTGHWKASGGYSLVYNMTQYNELIAKINKLAQYFRDYEQYEIGKRTKKAIRKEES